MINAYFDHEDYQQIESKSRIMEHHVIFSNIII